MLLTEVEERIAGLPDDAAILAAAEAIETLAERRGQVLKGQVDTERLTIELRLKEARVTKLRRDVGMTGQELPRGRRSLTCGGWPVLVVRRPRVYAIARTEEEHRSRLAPLERRLADAELTPGLRN